LGNDYNRPPKILDDWGKKFTARRKSVIIIKFIERLMEGCVVMFGYWLIMCFVVIGLNLGSGNLAWSQNDEAGRDEGDSFQGLDKTRDGNAAKDRDQLFSPIKPGGKESFLILDPDGKTASNSQKFLSPLDQIDKKPDN
jgi:hypothetical protein